MFAGRPLLGACSQRSESQTDASCPGGLETDPHGYILMNTEQLKQFARRYTAAWNSETPESVADHFAEGATLFVNGTPASGREAITEVAHSFMTGFPDMELSMDTLVIKENTVEYHWTFAGTNTGPGGTGNAVRFSGFEEWTLGGDGLIAQSVGQFDQEDYEHQLEHGVGPGRP